MVRAKKYSKIRPFPIVSLGLFLFYMIFVVVPHSYLLIRFILEPFYLITLCNLTVLQFLDCYSTKIALKRYGLREFNKLFNEFNKKGVYNGQKKTKIDHLGRYTGWR